MKAPWLVIGFLTALGLVAWSAWGDVHHFLVNTNTATLANDHGYGRATVEFAQIAVSVDIPLTEDLQHLGLGGRTHLGELSGMLFQYAEPDVYTFWMNGMKIPLDIIWMVDDQVVTITPDLPPPAAGEVSLPIYRPDRPVTDVLEVRAGFAKKHGVKVGDVVRIDRR